MSGRVDFPPDFDAPGRTAATPSVCTFVRTGSDAAGALTLPAEAADGFADEAAAGSGFADDADCLAMGCLPFFDSDSLATAALAPIAGRALFVPTMGR